MSVCVHETGLCPLSSNMISAENGFFDTAQITSHTTADFAVTTDVILTSPEILQNTNG